MVDLTDYLWILWLVFILVAITIELLSLEFTFLMISIGSLGGLAANLLGLDWWLQIVVAAGLSVLLLLTIRPFLLRALRKGGDPARSNIDALIGMTGRVVSTVTETGGLVKLANGETWTARLLTPGGDSIGFRSSVEPGQLVTVHLIEGSTAVVFSAERTQNHA
ncbi:NfeD family protein [Cryobacterium sp. TMT1-3]|uniref:NfeD family protein n=1 Tax=Cryobacterium luteum TaxID=1424661 RepID=A0A1H8D8F1_9MICO|nr:MULTISPECIES: NfeD family protein [Cryobacterium]TFB91931.1 NfeD family protein [Cryobacterium luteum]TFC31095.1 NfeD family protein [Cryobacterium sp. TMT1-3]SEN03550.1 Membrane protein implicated in regulation of membrane protease activity [Cryobacterium luteum]